MKINENIEILQGDCIELLEKIPEHTVNSIITDPPYFLGMTHNGQKGVLMILLSVSLFMKNSLRNISVY